MALSVVLVTGGFDHKIRFWEATTGICSRTLRFGESQVNKLQISDNKLHVAAGGNPHLQIYEVNSTNDNPLQTFEGHTQNVTDLGFQKDSKWLYSCSEDGTMKIWDMRAPGCQLSTDCRSALNTIQLHPNESEIITGDQAGCLKVWDMHTNTCRFEEIPQADVPVRSISISKDANTLAVGLHKGKVCLYSSKDKDWNLETSFAAHDEYLLKCLISPDMATLATTSADHSIKLWQLKQGGAGAGVEDGGGSVGASKSTVGKSGDCVGIPLIKCLAHHQRWVWDAVFSADSSYMVSTSSDQSAKLWDLRSGEVIRNYLGHNLAVTCVALNDSNVE